MVGVKLENVSKSFGPVNAVDSVSLEIEKGSLFFLLGPSGCGKTTILRMIAGFETPSEGDIVFDDRSVTGIPAHKRNTGLVFQEYALWPHMTVEQNVAYGLDERRVRRREKAERTRAALAGVHMEGFEKRMPNELSGGQQQRIALARALVIEPDVILLDEPLSNLDARLRLEMRHEIRRIHDETGITMIYVTHDQKEALSMADIVAVMGMGHVKQTDPPRELYRRPNSRSVAEFVGEANVLEGNVAGIEGSYAVVRAGNSEFKVKYERETFSEGDNVLFMVRPECITFDGTKNTFTAEVSNSVYLGETEQFELETDHGTLKVFRMNTAGRAPGKGEKLTAGFAPEDAVILDG